MKKNIGKLIAVSMAFAVMSSTAAFAAKIADPVAAEETEDKDDDKDEVDKDDDKDEDKDNDKDEDKDEDKDDDKDEDKDEDKDDEDKDDDEDTDVAYINMTGKIVEISTDEKGNKIVTIDNEKGGLCFVVAPTTVLVDRETNAQVNADQLKNGMAVAVVYQENAPMGMSLPPYLGQVAAVVTNVDKGNVSIGLFNDELVNEADKLQLNIADKTPILTTLGTKSILSADDVKDETAVVFYDVTTRSIPAQTTPSMILLVQTEEKAEVETEVGAKEVKAPEMVSLRDAAKEKGYNVVWQGKNKPVLVSKDDVKVEISLGSVSYTIDGKTTLTAQAAAALQDGKMCVSADVIANLK